MQHLQSGLALEIAMLPQIDLGLTAASKEPYEGVVAQLLSGTICHTAVLFPHEEKNAGNMSRPRCLDLSAVLERRAYVASPGLL
jgi:hypothetical protein